MSQGGVVSVGGGGGTIQVTPDVGSVVVPVAGNINIFGGTDVQTSGAGSTLTIKVTNTVTGTVTTNNNAPTPIITFALGAVAGVYLIEGRVAAFNTTDTAGAAFFFIGSVRTTGAAGVEIGSEVTDPLTEIAMTNANTTFVVSGNNVIINAVGLVGKTIDWSADFEYRFVS